MIDTFGRSVTYLRVSVTDLCNLRCRYCMPEDGVCKKEHADMLTEDEFIQAVEAAVALGITKLRLTGGEPLVKKEYRVYLPQSNQSSWNSGGLSDNKWHPAPGVGKAPQGGGGQPVKPEPGYPGSSEVCPHYPQRQSG